MIFPSREFQSMKMKCNELNETKISEEKKNQKYINFV